MTKSLANSLHTMVDSALSILEDKVLRLGEWYESFWIACAAFAMGRCRLEGRPDEAKANAIERITKLYYKVLAFQDRQGSTMTPPATQVSYLMQYSTLCQC